MREARISDSYHIYYEKNRLWSTTTWFGVPCWKFPSDAFLLQELVYKLQPEFIVETGTACGGSALFFASILHILQKGSVITIDINNIPNRNTWPQISTWLFDKYVQFIKGNSTDENIVSEVFKTVGDSTCLVVLDSWHTKEHVLNELNIYHKLVKSGYYIVVEDTHVNGNPIQWKWGDGPMEAATEFLNKHTDFQSDLYYERLDLTYNPNGWLKRI
jgi:cephalosporin hydroxylase